MMVMKQRLKSGRTEGADGVGVWQRRKGLLNFIYCICFLFSFSVFVFVNWTGHAHCLCEVDSNRPVGFVLWAQRPNSIFLTLDNFSFCFRL